MLGAAMLLFAPVLAEGRVFGHGVVGAVAPVGLQVAFGSLIFGLGMQLGGGCGSGTLYTVGGGSTRMVITLVAFCAGGLWGSLDLEFWATAPRWRSVSLAAEFGWPLALALQIAVLGALWFGLRRWAGAVAQRPLWSRRLGWRDLARGPWPLLLGAGLLALLNWLTLLIAGHPWTITWGFTLWGAKAAAALAVCRTLGRFRLESRHEQIYRLRAEPGVSASARSRDWIPEDDLAHFVIEAVERVEMSAFKVNHRGTGSAQYHPRARLGPGGERLLERRVPGARDGRRRVRRRHIGDEHRHRARRADRRGARRSVCTDTPHRAGGALAAVIGGLAMGYGARLAFGCNIGAFFSGVASTSLHGWLWIVCALAGTWIGVRLRPLFGLPR